MTFKKGSLVYWKYRHFYGMILSDTLDDPAASSETKAYRYKIYWFRRDTGDRFGTWNLEELGRFAQCLT